MELLCLGLNHKTAPVEVRERFAVGTTKLGESSSQLITLTGVSEGLVISTCNRTEFYLVATAAEEAFTHLERHLAEETQLDSSAAAHFYRKQKFEAAFHLCSVVSGLD